MNNQFYRSSFNFSNRKHRLFSHRFASHQILGDDEDRYVDSISRCLRWEAKGGKSGSNFYKSHDDRFILKQMSVLDLKSFQEFAPKYFGYMTDALKNKVSVHACGKSLVKVLG